AGKLAGGHDGGDDGRVADPLLQGARERGQARGVGRAAQEALVVTLYQVLLVLPTAEDRGRHLGVGAAVGQQAREGGRARGVGRPVPQVLEQGVDEAARRAAAAGRQVLRRSGYRRRRLLHRAATSQEAHEGRQTARVGDAVEQLVVQVGHHVNAVF